MGWTVDDIDLDTLAFNIQNRSASWKVPGKRGENLVIPGRHGSKWLPNKPFEEGNLTLNMFAVGANEDGTVPATGTAARKVRENIDKLTAIFGQSSKLLDVVRVSSSAFGIENSVIDPSFETGESQSPWATYQNCILNPTMRATAAGVDEVNNLMPNPVPQTLATPNFQNTYESLVQDSQWKLTRGDAEAIVTANSWAGGDNEDAAASMPGANWTTATNTQNLLSNTSAVDQTANPTGGTRMFRVNTTANLAANASLGFRDTFPTMANTTPYLSFRSRRAMATSTTRGVQVRILTKNSGGTTLTTGSWQTYMMPSYTNAVSDWVTFDYDSTGITTDSSGNIQVEFRTNEAWVTGDGVHLDNIVVTNSNQTTTTGGFHAGKAGPFFSAVLGWANLSYVAVAPWTRTRWITYKDTRWTAAPSVDATSAFHAFAYTPNDTDPSGNCVNFVAFGYQTGGTQDFYLNLENPTAGETYSMRFASRQIGSNNVRMQKKSTGDADYVDVGSSYGMSGGGTATTTGSQMTGTQTIHYPQSTYTAVAGDLMRLKVTTPVQTNGNPTLQLADIIVSNHPGALFNGNTTDTTNNLYSWAGTTYASKSIFQQRRMKRVTSKHGYWTDADPARIEVLAPGPSTTAGVTTENFAVINSTRGFYGSVLAAANTNSHADDNAYGVPSVYAQLVFLDAGSTITGTISGNPVVLIDGSSSGSYQTVSVTVPPSLVPASTTQVRLEVKFSNSLAGQIMRVKNIGIYTYGAPITELGLPSYFDGTTSGASWVSTAHDSTSKMTFAGTEPATWERDNGVNLGTWAAGGAQKSSKAADSYVGFRTPLGTTMAAQEYQFGVEGYAEVYNSAGTKLDIPIDVYLEFRSSSTAVVGSPVYLGTQGWLDDLKQPYQVTTTPSGTFTYVAIVFRARTAVASTSASIFRAYLYPSNPASFAPPTPRMDKNRVNNPYFTYGLSLWATTGSPTVSGDVCSLPNAATIQSSTPLSPPTLVRSVSVDFTTTGANKTSPTFDVVNGDLLVIQGHTADSTYNLSTPTWTGTGTVGAIAGATIGPVASQNNGYTWTVPVTATATGRTVNIVNSNSGNAWGFTVTVWRGHNGTGATAELQAATGAATTSITTTVLNSAIVVFVSDWIGAGHTGSPRTWATVNGAPIYEAAFGDSSAATYYSGYVTDAGSIGSKTIGLTTPTNMAWTLTAIEIRPAAPTAITGVAVQAPVRAGYVATSFSVSTAKTSPNFDVQQGDLIIIQGAAETNTGAALNTPTWTGTGGSVTLQEDLATGNSRGRIWSIDVTAAAIGRNVSITGYAGTGAWFMDVTIWRAHGGVGVQNQATGGSGAAQITQTVAANSAVQFMALDTVGTVATTPTWLTINSVPMEQTKFEQTSSVATVYGSYSPDVGSSGSKTFGFSAPSSGITWGATSIEILGAPQANFIARAVNGSGDGRLTPSLIWTKTDYTTVTVTLPTINSTSLNTPVRWTVAIPVNAAKVEVRYTSTVTSGSSPQVSYTYLGAAYAGFTGYKDVDPYPFYYGDATQGDYYGIAGWWSSAVDGSFSNFQPPLSPSWINNATALGVSVHELLTPDINYGVWNGKVGAILAAAKGATKTVRSVGVPTFGKSKISGEISVGTKPYATAVVKVYQASSTTASGTLVATTGTVLPASSAIIYWNDLVVSDGFVYVEVTYTETENVSGYRVFLDNFMMVSTNSPLASEYPGYFDGTVGGIWTGNANNSTSTYTGGGRRAWCEVTEAIDFTSQAGGTRAEFTVDMVIPGAFWEDLVSSTMTFTLPSLAGYEQTLHALVAATAPIDDAQITLTVTGTVTNLTLTDVASGAELTIAGTLPSIVNIDNANFRVTNQADASIISTVTRKNSNQLLPLNPVSSTEAPRIRVDGTGAGSITMKVVAKRRYLVA